MTNAVESTKNNMKSGSSPYEQGSNKISVFTTIKYNGRGNNKNNSDDENEGEVVVSIRDRGTGIDPEYRKRYSQYLLPNLRMDLG